MMIPTGYTPLEYIESTGTQYINTGVKSSSELSFELDIDISEASSTSNVHFLSANSSTYYFAHRIGNNLNGLSARWGNGSLQTVSAEYTGRHFFKWEKNVLTIDETLTITSTYVSFQTDLDIPIFCLNNSGKTEQHTKAKLYSLKMYDSDTLIRNFIPCKNASGVIGLYDDVNGVFYQNAGTGNFTAGPVAVNPPDAPTNLTVSGYGYNTVSLKWDAVECDGYNVYLNDTLYSTVTTNTCTLNAENGKSYTFSVSAYNAGGESDKISIEYTVPEFTLNLIADRTQEDVNRASYLLLAFENGTITDEEITEFLTELKGFYDYTDINRVVSAMYYISEKYLDEGYYIPIDSTNNWTMSDYFNQNMEYETYLNDLRKLRRAILVMKTTPQVPAYGDNLTYSKANDIEQILVDLDFLITAISKSLYYSDEIYAGEL